MQYNVSQLLKQPTGTTRHYPIEADNSDLDPELEVAAPLLGSIRLIRTAKGVLVTGDLHTEVWVACRRCLEPFRIPVSITLEEEFRPTIDINTGASLPLPDDDEEATRIDAHHILDLREVVRQSILLALPPFPLCREDCKGLCPQCGANLNTETCNCESDSADLPLSKLRELL